MAHALGAVDRGTRQPNLADGGDFFVGHVVDAQRRVVAGLHHRIHQAHSVLGIGVAANDIEFVLRALPSLRIRYDAHDRTARALASWLQQQPEVRQVLHPALPDSPGHVHWAALCQGAAGLVSMVFDAQQWPTARVHRFVDGLRLFKIGYSWGGPVSLVMPYGLQGMRQHGELAGHTGTLVRLSIGLESVEDLLADLDQALNAA